MITAKETHEIIDRELGKYHEHLEETLSLKFEVVNSGIAQINGHLAKINGRVGISEANIRQLQDMQLNHANICPHKEQIVYLSQRNLENEMLQKHTNKFDETKEKVQLVKERIFRYWTTGLTIFIIVLTFIINYYFAR